MKFLATLLLLITIGCANAQKTDHLRLLKISDEMQIVFSGDFMQHLPQVTAARISGGYDYDTQLKEIAPLWKMAHFSIINLETTLSPTGEYSGYPAFRSPDEVAFALARAGITHAAMANNHVVDRGTEGVKRTIAALDSANIKYFGMGFEENSTTMLEHKSLKVAVINATYGTNGIRVGSELKINHTLDTTTFNRQIIKAKKEGATHIIAFVHWGYEYHTKPSDEQTKLGMWLRSKGVNLVIGSHPHVAQPIDKENSIVYSLGNFVSNQRKPFTDAGYSVRITIREGVERPVIEHLAHYVDISKSGVEKYRILPLKDTLLVTDLTHRANMKKAIERVEKIIND